jgi:hypothetical protein
MPVTKKKGKKNIDVKTDVNETQTDPIVLQLSISNNRMNELIETENLQNILKYSPNIVDPQPYIPNDYFISSNDIIETNNNVSSSTNKDTTAQQHHMCTNKEEQKNIVSHHDTNCYWCCHPIIDIEYGMPIRYDVFHNNFTTYGSFCSLQCAAAYNYSVNMGCDKAWEIHSWIQLIGKKYGFKGPIRPAPSRYLLKMFHGPLTIEEFRKAHTNLIQTYMLNIPPFIHVSSQMELINTSFLDKEKSNTLYKNEFKSDNHIHSTTKTKKIIQPIQPKGELEQKMNLAFVQTLPSSSPVNDI